MYNFLRATVLTAVLLPLIVACNNAGKESKAETLATTEQSTEHAHSFACPMHPEVTGKEIDSEICRVTIANHAIDLSLKKEYVEQYKNDHVFQIRLLCNNERDFIVMGSMLEHLKEPIMQ